MQLTLARSTANPMTDNRKSDDVLHVSRLGSMAGIMTVALRGNSELLRNAPQEFSVGTETDAVRLIGEGYSVKWGPLFLDSQKRLLLRDFRRSAAGEW